MTNVDPLDKEDYAEVLLVEDIEDTVVGLTKDMEYRGTVVHQATTRQSAADMLRMSRFDAVLVDLNIPRAPGLQPSSKHGRQLVLDMCNGGLGELNRSTPFLLITAQQVDVLPSEFSAYPNYLGLGSKVGNARWIFQRLHAVGAVARRDTLDLEFEDPVRARVQVVLTAIDGGVATLDVPDLPVGPFAAPLRGTFTSGMVMELRRRRLPVALWAVANVTAVTPEELELREFQLSDEQIDPDRDYLRPGWLT